MNFSPARIRLGGKDMQPIEDVVDKRGAEYLVDK